MGSNKNNIKKFLFKCGTEALSSATGKTIEDFYCPICGKGFSDNDLENKNLTLEHIPPEAQGGKGIALTCVVCNTTAGRTVDIAATTRNHLQGLSSLFSQEGRFNTRVRVDFGQENLGAVNYELSVKDGAVRFYPVKNANRPDYASNMKELIEQTNSTPKEDRSAWNISTRKRYNPWHAKVGDLRSAFLVCFAKFGYNFAFDPALETVRNQIQNYDARIIDYFFLSLDPKIEPNFTMGIVTSPFTAIFCQLQNFGIFLPWVGSPKDYYNYLEKYNKTNGKLNFTFTPIPWPERFEAQLDFMNCT
ncbi:HNH endonuclease [Desulforhopalus sp. IMCC35007]|uniref:HNH endonuclease n=1 Tax=Desulforhopalus sp. IMCC35007 TaxID=2569543 RepID=UPI0010AE3EAB|nr:HNH endonuclease [Desulforhopalus sp. IMCC35007]TKB07449.1 HNH endonuclease [Desulforhopalus sp. IMCC35007]